MALRAARAVFLTSRKLQNRTDSLIGAGVCVSGNITFSGVLRIHDDVHGDVLCDADDIGTAVVGHSGKVIGSVKAPHIVVTGRVQGPVHSSAFIEIQLLPGPQGAAASNRQRHLDEFRPARLLRRGGDWRLWASASCGKSVCPNLSDLINFRGVISCPRFLFFRHVQSTANLAFR